MCHPARAVRAGQRPQTTARRDALAMTRSSRDVAAKVAFVSDNVGTTFVEVTAAVAVVVTAAVAVVTLDATGAWRTRERLTALKTTVDAIALVTASLAAMFAPERAITASCIVAGACSMYYWLRRRRGAAAAAAAQFAFDDAIVMYRFTLAILTVIAILAVDFTPFPRRFGKTETYGVSLMDVGGGSYVFSSAIVSRFARDRARRTFSSSVRHVIPLIVLGLVRLVTTAAVGYHSIESEYGRHWNFFFTLAAVKISADVLPIAAERASASGVAIALGYQYFLVALGASAWILQQPSERNHSGGALARAVSMNREGVCSVIGYYAIHLIAVDVGRKFSRPVGDAKRWMLRNWISTGVFWGLALVLHEGVEHVSRRAANAAYVFWVVAYNLQVLMSYVAIAHLSRSLTGTFNVPRLARAVSENQLAVFLMGNVFTGAVNLSMDTIGARDTVAWMVVLTYACSLCFIALKMPVVERARRENNNRE